jgi:hypothetical protein
MTGNNRQADTGIRNPSQDNAGIRCTLSCWGGAPTSPRRLTGETGEGTSLFLARSWVDGGTDAKQQERVVRANRKYVWSIQARSLMFPVSAL